MSQYVQGFGVWGKKNINERRGSSSRALSVEKVWCRGHGEHGRGCGGCVGGVW